MTTTATTWTPTNRGHAAVPGDPAVARTSGRMWSSRLIGALFLAGFLMYGNGSIPGELRRRRPRVPRRRRCPADHLALGAFLMIATAAVDIGKAVFFPVLERHGRRTAVAYLATMVFEMAMMTVGEGARAAHDHSPADQADAGRQSLSSAQALGSLAVDVNETDYQIGQFSLAFGCLFLCALLIRSGLIPRWLAAWGMVGYALHMAGAAAEIFGAPTSLVLLIPGGIFEVTLAIWLLVKGFAPAAYEGIGRVTALGLPAPGTPQRRSARRWAPGSDDV